MRAYNLTNEDGNKFITAQDSEITFTGSITLSNDTVTSNGKNVKDAIDKVAAATLLLDSHVVLATKIADADICQTAGTAAFAMNPVKYPYTACASATELLSKGYTFETTVDDCFLALSEFDNCNLDISHVETWESPMPSLQIWSFSTSYFNNLSSWTGELQNLKDGNSMFINAANLTEWDTKLPRLTDGTTMFKNSGLLTFVTELPNLTNGTEMFSGAGLTEWNTSLPNLTNGTSMFSEMSYTLAFNGELPKLEKGTRMFYGTSLEGWNTELPSLTSTVGTDGNANNFEMFKNSGLTTWSIDLPKITTFNDMFSGCQFTSFKSTLPSLTNGDNAFKDQTALTDINVFVPNVVSAQSMFENTSITSWDQSVSTLKNTKAMFKDCTHLNSFDGSLCPDNYVMASKEMFSGCSALTTFYNGTTMSFAYASDTNKNEAVVSMFEGCSSLTALALTIGTTIYDTTYMFKGCSSLASFPSSINLTYVRNGKGMFYGCTSLTSVSNTNNKLSNILVADGMFYHCNLDITTVKFIADNIKSSPASASRPSYISSEDWTNVGKITLGVSAACAADSTFTTQMDAIANKGWTITYAVQNTDGTFGEDIIYTPTA